MQYKNFKLKELFISQTGDTDIKQEHINNTGYYVCSSGDTNYGIIGKSDIESKIIKGNSLTVDMFGSVYYRDFNYKLVTHARIFTLEGNFSKNVMLYIASYLKKLKLIFSYNNMCSWKKIQDYEILLPSSDGINPNYQFMDSLISELEQERISELDKYLKTTGLNDYLLNDEDIKTLNKKVLFKNFKVNELFDIHPTKTYKGNNSYLISKNGKIPVVANTSTNNGIGGYSNLMATEKGGIITFSDTTTADSIFYQPNDFIGYSHVQGMYPYSNLWNEKSLRYFMTIFKKVALSKNFDYANKFNRKLALEFVVMLPTIDGTNLDYDYMEKYITAIEKVTIKNVVEYKDDIIAKTKEICKSK